MRSRMTKLRVLDRDGDCKADAVALLKKWLAKAEAGEVIYVAVVADLADDHSTMVQASRHDNLAERLGNLRLLEHQLIDGARA